MRYVILTIFVLFSNLAYGGVEEIMDATCKINMGGFAGTGTVFREDAEYVWVIGAGHVGSPNKEGTITFYHNGQEGEKIPMKVVWRVWDNKQNTNDIAFYKFKKPDGLKFKVIPLAPKDYPIKVDEVVFSYGCAYGVWPSMWRGKILSLGDTRLGFQPCPAIGRSGSALFNREGTMIIGIVVMSDGTDKGVAVSLSKIYELLPNAK